MASRFNKFRLLSLGLVLLGLTGWAQPFPVQVQVSVVPPYSAYLQDYPGTGQQVRVFLVNTSRQTYQIRLTGQLTGDNGIEIHTLPSYRPPRPLTVPPGQTLLSRNDLEGLFDLNQIAVTGIDKNRLARGLPLPDGTYQLCVRAYNETATNTATTPFGQPLSAEFPLGCSAPIVVRAVEPPILIAPLCDADIIATTPQTVVFTWTPPVGVSPAQVDYTLRVVELPQVDVDPNVFIDAVALPRSGVEVRNLRTTTFLYGPTQPPLQAGKRYAWRVQAIDRSGKLNFLNDGKAPVCAFTYGTTTIAAADTTTLVQTVWPPKSASAVAQFTFCGQTILVKKVTDPSLDHFTGKGSLVMKSPVKLTVDIDFADLMIRPLTYAKREHGNYTVVKGQLERSLMGGKVDGKAASLKTDPHTGGTATISYQAIRLMANHIAEFDESKNSHVLKAGGTENAEIQTGISWRSPISVITGIVVKKNGNQDPLKQINTGGYTDGNLVVDVPGDWHPIGAADKQVKLASSLNVSFGTGYKGTLTDLKGFDLSLDPESYFEISNGTLTARLTGDLLVPSGRKGINPLKVSFQETNGIAFTGFVNDPKIPISLVKDDVRSFLSFTKLNVLLGDLFDADDLTAPAWVKGVSCPAVDFWIRSGDYDNDKLTWTVVPINAVINRGNGYESTDASRKGLNIGMASFQGFKGKITQAVTIIKNTELKHGHLVGQVYIPFIATVGLLQIWIEPYGLADAEVVGFEKAERTLLQTPAGERITVKATGGYFADGYFYPDMSFSVYNDVDETRGLNARDILMDGIDVGISPKGELVSNYKGKKAEAFYSGSKQKTAYLNGLDYHLARVILTDVGGGKQCRMAFNGKLVLGEKIITGNEYLYDVVFNKPQTDAFSFEGTTPTPVLNNMPKSGGGPYIDGSEDDLLPTTEPAQDYYLERAAPASLMLFKANTISGSFGTGTAFYNADFTYYTDDATYGNGFKAETKASIFSPVNTLVKASVIAGKAQGVKYWFAAFKYESKDTPGIPLFLNLEAYGFEGRIYSHMKHVGDPAAIFNENYVPDANTSFGLYAALPIQSIADKGRLVWGKTAIEAQFKGFAPSIVRLRGVANIEQLGGTGDATTSRIQGQADIEVDIANKTLIGHVDMSRCDMIAACASGSAFFYLGPSGFAVAAGFPSQPIDVQAFCGSLGKLTPSAQGYVMIYATNGPIGGVDWIPESGIGIRAHLTATLLDLDSRAVLANPWARLSAKANTEINVTIRPSISLQGSINTIISLDAGYEGYSINLANEIEALQISLPNPVCIAYNKRICYPVLGGVNIILGVKDFSPVLRVNGDVSDMCYNDGTIQGSCEGLVGWLADGVDIVIDAAGKVLGTAAELAEEVCDVVCPWNW